MKHFRVVRSLTLLVIGLGLMRLPGRAQTDDAVSFQEVYALLRSNLTSVSEADLNRAAAAGLLKELKGKAILTTNATNQPDADSISPIVTKTRVFDDAFGYVRIGRVASGLRQAFDSACESLVITKLKGLIIDLRFANGHEYAAVADLAGRFTTEEQTLFKIGEQSIRSSRSEHPIGVPLAVLVNHETTGAAEVLAAVLRQMDAGLVIGGATAGQAHPFSNFRLSNGQILRIASGTVELGNGKALTDQGVTPDIHLSISLPDEKPYFDDPYWSAARPQNQTDPHFVTNPANRGNPFGRRRLNEADLVRMQREGLDFSREAAMASAATEPPKPSVQDPALSRALDFLKGMAVAQNRR